MTNFRSAGTNRGISKSGIVIREGARPLIRQEVIDGKGKQVAVDREYEDSNVAVNGKIVLDNIPDVSGSAGAILKVNKFVLNHEEQLERDLVSEIDDSAKEVVDDLPLKKLNLDKNLDSSALRESDLNVMKENFKEAWKRMQHIKISNDNMILEMSEDGMAVKLNAEKEMLNSEVLKHSLVIKVLGDKVSFPLCSLELRNQWSKFGSFHMTSIGLNWILCSFKSADTMEEVLNGGPWFVGGHIVGMDKWSPFFNPNSFRGITAPVWVRFPCLPLYCWDEENINRIASRIGAPMLLDGNSFKWGKREFARVCIRLNLENSLPNGVWVDGIVGHFFQRIEYEKIDLICYQCGKVGHDSKLCPESVKKVHVEQPVKKAGAKRNVDGKADREGAEEANENYGPWIHVKFKNRRFWNGKARNFDKPIRNTAGTEVLARVSQADAGHNQTLEINL